MASYYIRPRIQYQASCAILCRAGKDLGATMTGHHDFQLADDIIHKVHIGHYTFYSCAVVKNDKLFIKARGVFARKYLGGEGVQSAVDANDSLVRSVGQAFRDGAFGGVDGGGLGDATATPTIAVLRAANSVLGSGDTLFSDEQEVKANLLVRGTYVSQSSSFINPLGFGPYTYQGCRAGREGRGVPLKRENTVADIQRLTNLMA